MGVAPPVGVGVGVPEVVGVGVGLPVGLAVRVGVLVAPGVTVGSAAVGVCQGQGEANDGGANGVKAGIGGAVEQR